MAILWRKSGNQEMLKIDQGYIAMFEEHVDFDITTVKGLKISF